MSIPFASDPLWIVPYVIPAPPTPPSSAWVELDGRPSHHVVRFHRIAPTSPDSPIHTYAGSFHPTVTYFEITFATPSPKIRNATKLKNAAHSTATFGDKTRVDTTVAIEFAASWKPLMTSKPSARTIV